MYIRFLRVLVFVFLVAMALTISRITLGGHPFLDPQSVFVSTYCSEGERAQGLYWYTVHRAVAYARANTYNDMGDYNDGWYIVAAGVPGDTDSEQEYYSGSVRAKAEAEVLHLLSPGEISGTGWASSYIYGIGCVDSTMTSCDF